MDNRSAAYFKRKKTFKEVLNPTDLKSMLKAEFYSSKNLLVKRDVLKMYQQLYGKKKA